MEREHHLKELERLKSRYQTKKALTLHLLWMIQNEQGWISPEAMKYAADLLEVPLRHIYGVVTFYTMFNTEPVGKYHLQVCTNVSCQLRGAEKILDHLCARLNIRPGGTSSDGRFTVTEVECLGSCGTAPMMQMNDGFEENLTTDRIDHLLSSLK